jgi:epoxyqueuosine reductase
VFGIGLHGVGFDVQLSVHRRHEVGGPLGPFHQLEAGAGEQFPKARVLPLARVGEAVEVEMPDGQRLARGHERAVDRAVRLHHRVGRALDAPLHPQRAQQVPHERGLARAQVALQGERGTGNGRAGRQALREGGGIGLIGPAAAPDRAVRGGWRSYNRRDMTSGLDAAQLMVKVQAWGRELALSQIGVAGVDLSAAEPGLLAWLDAGFHGDMAYMASHGLRRARPAELVPGTVSVITARLDYLPRGTQDDWTEVERQRLLRPGEAIVSVYARGRDYHKVLRGRLQKLAERIAVEVGPFGHRAFTDSAPVLEAELAQRSGQGWRGKHTLVLSRDGGSMFFLGEIYVDLALPVSEPVTEHCGACNACIEVCPTQAIVAPHRLDARRCISYLTIEHAGPIPEDLRPLMGNRIYGCDDCQTACPWNKFAQRSPLPDFDPREGLTGATLVELFGWSEADFLRRTEGSPIRRIGHARWQRNIAVAMGNALRQGEDPAIRAALLAQAQHPDATGREHVGWALAQAQPA